MNDFFLLCLLCGVILTVLRPRPVIASFMKPTQHRAWLLVPIAIGAFAALSLLLSLLFPAQTSESTGKLWITLLLHACIPAVIEEILFRAMIFSSLSSVSGWAGLLCSSLLFACVHPMGPEGLYAFCCGLILGCVMLLTKSVWCVMVIHVLNNAATILLQNNRNMMMIVNVCLIIVGLFVLVIYLQLFRRKTDADR